MNNINQMMQMYQQLRSNPMQILAKRFNLPQNMNMNNPSDIIQHLLNTGQVSQQQINSLMGMRNNPMIQQLMQKKF
jgi:ferritin